jgi:hypothetical protein
MKVFGVSLPIPKKIPIWVGIAVGAVTLVLLFLSKGGADAIASCPGSQVYCTGVGCVSGKDKCTPNSAGGPSAVFSKETFEGQCKAMTTCPGGYRSDGPCLMEFPSF